MIKISTDIDFAVQLLNNDKIIGFPTETVYGLAGNIFSKKAVNRIFETKQRPKFNPLIVHISKMEQLEQLATAIPENARFLAKAFWPGPLTLLLKKHPSVSDLITAGKPTVAVRIPNHPMALAILNAIDFPLAAPSANPFGKISPTSAQHVADFFPIEIEAVFDGGECQNGIESTIIGFDGDHVIVYRLGAVAVEEIEAVVGKVKVFTSDNIAPNAPGMLKKHYSPNTNFVLTTDVEKEIEKHHNKRIGVLSFNKNYKSEFIAIISVLSKNSDFKEASRKLYNVMHQLDKENLDIIIAEKFPDLDLGKSINDRLMRAAEK